MSLILKEWIAIVNILISYEAAVWIYWTVWAEGT